MEARRFLPMVVFSLLAGTACVDPAKEAETVALRADVAALGTDMGDLKKWLGRSPQKVDPPATTIHDWHLLVYNAICRLEDKAQIPMADRMCQRDSDHNAPPKPPPFN